MSKRRAVSAAEERGRLNQMIFLFGDGGDTGITLARGRPINHFSP